MEFWTTFNNMQETLRLPVPPEEFTLQQGTEITTVNINAVGEIALIGKSSLRSISFSSYFPAQDYAFCQYHDFPKPYDCVAMIEKWRTSQKPVRFTITDTSINGAFAIETFDYGERFGGKDIYFDIALKEYKFLSTKPSANTTATTRPDEKQISKSYTVKEGDNLSLIAKQEYGDASNYTVIVKKNNIINPDSLKAGQVLFL